MMEFEEIIAKKRGTLPADRLTIADGAEDLRQELTNIGTGVLFIYAIWSGNATASFRSFCNAIAAAPNANFPIHVINNDTYDVNTYRKVLGELPHGMGEAYWIKNGQIIYRDLGYADLRNLENLPKRIDEFTNY